jgi:formylglycine-generating enzyme required for sulfatase activity
MMIRVRDRPISLSNTMKIQLFLFIMLLAAAAPAAIPQQPQGPMNKNQVMALVKAGMQTPELVKLIHEHGIDFDLTDDYLQSLRKAGAQEPVLQALRAARPKPLNKEQVLQLVVGEVPSQRAAALVREHGIDFQLDEEYVQTLRLAGADEVLIGAVRLASERAKPPGPAPGMVRENSKDGLKYILIPPGTFTMGCSMDDSACAGDENPAHKVTITKSFWLGQTEVTVGAYKRFAREGGRSTPPEPDAGSLPLNSGWANEAMPIVDVTWDDAQAFCRWGGGRLPTEAEWEYAARAGSTSSRYGNLNDVAWSADNSGRQILDTTAIYQREKVSYYERLRENGNGIHEAAQKLPNRFGLYDMLGNVWEWVNDWYDPRYYQNSPSQDPGGPASGEERVLRGGSWNGFPSYIRVSVRTGTTADIRLFQNGFRCGGDVFKP